MNPTVLPNAVQPPAISDTIPVAASLEFMRVRRNDVDSSTFDYYIEFIPSDTLILTPYEQLGLGDSATESFMAGAATAFNVAFV